MPENTDSVIARRVKDPTALQDSAEGTRPGDFAWEFDFTHFPHGAAETDAVLTCYIHLPGDRSRWAPIHVQRGPAPTTHVWGWDGNLDRPTFTPSIHHPGFWHGHMVAGQLLSCGAARLPEPAADPRHRPPQTNAHPMLNFAQATPPAVYPQNPAGPDRRDPRRIGGWGS
jgi:hypothetical protein